MVLGMRGVHRFPASVITLLYGIDKAIGNDLEKALHELKRQLE